MAVTAGPLGTEEIVYVAREDGCAYRYVERQDLATLTYIKAESSAEQDSMVSF
jgi:hypothetical protein